MSNTYKAYNALLVERVNKLEQQRYELLEVLKEILYEYEGDGYCVCLELIAQAHSAITKAEAAE